MTVKLRQAPSAGLDRLTEMPRTEGEVAGAKVSGYASRNEDGLVRGDRQRGIPQRQQYHAAVPVRRVEEGGGGYALSRSRGSSSEGSQGAGGGHLRLMLARRK